MSDLLPLKRAFQLVQHLLLAEVALDEVHISHRLHLEHVEPDDDTVNAATLLAGQLASCVLAPAARRAAQVNDRLARTDQLLFLINFLELVRCARAIALALRQLYIGIVDVVVDPVLVDFAFSHTAPSCALLLRCSPLCLSPFT